MPQPGTASTPSGATDPAHGSGRHVRTALVLASDTLPRRDMALRPPQNVDLKQAHVNEREGEKERGVDLLVDRLAGSQCKELPRSQRSLKTRSMAAFLTTTVRALSTFIALHAHRYSKPAAVAAAFSAGSGASLLRYSDGLYASPGPPQRFLHLPEVQKSVGEQAKTVATGFSQMRPRAGVAAGRSPGQPPRRPNEQRCLPPVHGTFFNFKYAAGKYREDAGL